jgi:hypothetical protein
MLEMKLAFSMAGGMLHGAHMNLIVGRNRQLGFPEARTQRSTTR